MKQLDIVGATHNKEENIRITVSVNFSFWNLLGSWCTEIRLELWKEKTKKTEEIVYSIG